MAKNNDNFIIVHLSDLHLTASDKAARSEARLFGALRGMNVAFRKIVQSEPVQKANLILVTGDVTDRGDKKSWQVFWNAIRAAKLATKVLVIPGNHDMCCLGMRLPVLSKTGYRKADLEKAVTGLKMGKQPVKLPWAKIPDPRVAIFGLNSNNLGNFSAIDNAVGKIGHYQLVSFASKLHKHRNVPIKIVMLHHSPNIPMPETMKKRYGRDPQMLNRLFSFIPQDQRRTLRLLCLSHRIRLIAHGHLHLDEDRRVNGIRIIGAPATTEPAKIHGKKAGYQFYQYTIKGKKPKLYPKLITIRV